MQKNADWLNNQSFFIPFLRGMLLGAKLALNPKCPLCVKGGWRTALCVRGDCAWYLHIPAWIFYSNKALAISFLCATISCEIWRSFKARVRLYTQLLLFPKIFYYIKSFREPYFRTPAPFAQRSLLLLRLPAVAHGLPLHKRAFFTFAVLPHLVISSEVENESRNLVA